jgi:glycosyltransferase involved in cell wall biosynthesis
LNLFHDNFWINSAALIATYQLGVDTLCRLNWGYSMNFSPASNVSVSLVVPTLNEESNVGHVLEALPPGINEIILVDGGSTDGTVGVAREVCPDITVIRQARKGKGNALVAGFHSASCERIVAIDADGSMDPSEILRFLAAMDRGAEYVRGSRFLPGGGSTDITPLRTAGNLFLNGVANAFFRTRYTDLCYGFNAMTRSSVRALEFPDPFDARLGRVWGDGFEIETLMSIRAVKAGLNIIEVPSFEADRISGESNLNSFRDGSRCLRTLIAEKISAVPVAKVHDPRLGVPGLS